MTDPDPTADPVRALALAVRAYCDCVDAIGESAEPPKDHIARLDELEAAMRQPLAAVEAILNPTREKP